jgi:hypothetical protein
MKKFALFLMFVPCFYLSQMKTGTFSEMELCKKKTKTYGDPSLYRLVCSL